MKRLTIRVDDETYDRAVAAAAQRDITLDDLVQEFLEDLIQKEANFEALHQQEIQLREQIKEFSCSENLSREELHDRARLRSETQ